MFRSEGYLAAAFALAVLVSLGAPAPVHASLLGATVQLSEPGGQVFNPVQVVAGREYQDGDNTDFDIDFGLVPGEYVDIGGNTIELNLARPVSLSLQFLFSSFVIPTTFSGVSLVSTDSAIENSDLSFTANSVTIDLNGSRRGNTLITIAGVPPGVDPIPEPGTWALMLSGCAGLALYSRRRKAA